MSATFRGTHPDHGLASSLSRPPRAGRLAQRREPCLLHPECHDRVHRQYFSVSKPRPPKEAFEGPEPYDGKLSRPVLRRPAPSNGGWLLGDAMLRH
jgi:hypothetical protein